MKKLILSTLLVIATGNSAIELAEIEAAVDANKDEKNLKKATIEIDTKNFYSLAISENEITLPVASKDLLTPLAYQAKVLKRKQPFKVKHQFTGLELSKTELKERLVMTVDNLQNWVKGKDTRAFDEIFDLYQLNGFNEKGNMQFTAYYTPIFPVNETKSEDFQYPIYITTTEKDTSNQYLTTKLWASKENTAKVINMQGSGYLQFPNGEKKLVAFRKEILDDVQKPKKDADFGENIYLPYKGITKGSVGVPLTANRSIAVDPKYIPYGSCVLAKVPVVNEKGKRVGYENRILFAQDTGGMIKKMHVDLYYGIGDEAAERAMFMNRYSKMWLILAKP